MKLSIGRESWEVHSLNNVGLNYKQKLLLGDKSEFQFVFDCIDGVQRVSSVYTEKQVADIVKRWRDQYE